MTTYILGGGVTGLAAGMASGFPILEAEPVPGGICASYYVRPAESTVLHERPANGEAYHFEVGGGHWIFGEDQAIINLIQRLTPVERYSRRSAIYFSQRDLYIDYPIQDNLRFFGDTTAQKILSEIENGRNSSGEGPPRTMESWLELSFGPTLFEIFFKPFHDLYTGGLTSEIAPQDAYKSPVNLACARDGARSTPKAAVGYNSQYIYPKDGLDSLARQMARMCNIEYNCLVVCIDAKERRLYFADGSERMYSRLIVTLPLNKVMEITGLDAGTREDPYTSTLVLNIGARRGDKCPYAHWVYTPETESRFHRVGFYSNVDPQFLPSSFQRKKDRVSIYVERAFPMGLRPSETEIQSYAEMVIRELQAWQYIKDTEVVHPTWIDVAYTWSWPGSKWIVSAMDVLKRHGIHMVGRYARWHFQGIADSIRDGLYVGAEMNIS